MIAVTIVRISRDLTHVPVRQDSSLKRIIVHASPSSRTSVQSLEKITIAPVLQDIYIRIKNISAKISTSARTNGNINVPTIVLILRALTFASVLPVGICKKILGPASNCRTILAPRITVAHIRANRTTGGFVVAARKDTSYRTTRRLAKI